MGLDVNIYVGGAVTDEELERAQDEFAHRVGYMTDARLERGWEGRVELDAGGARYWSPNYERGPWPTIHNWIRGLRASFPGHSIHYGSDGDWEHAPEVTDEMLAEYWAHWESPHWDDYHNRRRQ